MWGGRIGGRVIDLERIEIEITIVVLSLNLYEGCKNQCMYATKLFYCFSFMNCALTVPLPDRASLIVKRKNRKVVMILSCQLHPISIPRAHR